MANAFLGRRFKTGPLALIITTAGAIVLGVVGMHLYGGDAANLLYFFYIPVAAVSVILGKKTGVCVAAFAVAAVVVSGALGGFDSFVSAGSQTAQKTAAMALWAVFLAATAWLVGWISERGGSLSLTRGLGARAVRAIERERRRTGQDIHDGLAQYAAAAYMETEILASMEDDLAPEARAQIERVRQNIGNLVEEARTMVGYLRPAALGPSEFHSTFRQLVRAFESRTGIQSEMELDGDFSEHSDSMRICIYRTTQEALANVEKHSEATRVKIGVRADKGGVDLTIWDNGKGFDPKQHENGNGNGNGHYGLQGMEERAGYLGGRVVVRSAPGEGASIVVHVPAYGG